MIFLLFVQPNTSFPVMERLDGLDLVAYLSPLGVDRWCYTKAEALEYIRQTGKALAYVQ
jgi:hypothetical protein